MTDCSFVTPAVFNASSSRLCDKRLSSNSTTKLTNQKQKQKHQPSKQFQYVTICSTKIPAHFNSIWYKESVIPLDVDVAVNHIKYLNDTQTDYHFIDHEKKIMGIVDYPTTINEDGYNNNKGEKIINYLENVLNKNKPLCSNIPITDMNYIFSQAIKKFNIAYGFSGILIDISTPIMRLVSIGACGLILIRDDKIIYRSYPTNSATSVINHLSSPLHDSNSNSNSNSNNKNKNKNKSNNINHLIHTDFIELQENDLIIAGTDGLFANLSDLQILSFVRPVPDRQDKTLAIANNTCLGSWTSDDVDFISYYLTYLATNFSTAENSKSILKYPFPPSPHLDDVTVLCASCSFL